MATTYEAIATVTVGSGGAANIEFTSIPGTYTDLVIKASVRSTHNDVGNINLYFNNSSANFSFRNLFGNGTAAGSNNNTNNNIGILQGSNYTASTFSDNEIYIPNYAGSTNKSVSVDAVTENNATQSYQVFTATLWAQTAAITSIKLEPTTANFVQYSTATLYGIKNS